MNSLTLAKMIHQKPYVILCGTAGISATLKKCKGCKFPLYPHLTYQSGPSESEMSYDRCDELIYWLTWKAVIFEWGSSVHSGYLTSPAASRAVCHGRSYDVRHFSIRMRCTFSANCKRRIRAQTFYAFGVRQCHLYQRTIHHLKINS